MTEKEWFACSDPQLLIEHLSGRRIYNRKLRLFACVCCRRIWHLFGDERSREAVEVAERFVNGKATRHELARAASAADAVVAIIIAGIEAARSAGATDKDINTQVFAADAAWRTAAPDSIHKNVGSIAWGTSFVEELDRPGANSSIAELKLLRDIFGKPHPFPQPSVEKAWLAWNEGAVINLAQQIYDQGRFELLPTLGNALKEAGCHDEAILQHCRSENEHVHGCWVVDMLLGMQ